MTDSFAMPATEPTATLPAALPDATPASWYGLGVLILVAMFAVLDRQVFVILAEPIRLNLGLSDFELGLLQGLGVALFASIAGYPIGMLADRFDRRRVLAGCIAVWSLAVVACGFAQSFPQLLIASAIVGAGEAGLLPVIFSIIPDMFRNEKRQLANSLNMIVSRVGIGLVIALAGYLTVMVDWSRPFLPAGLSEMETWRLTFFAAALPAPLLMALLVTLPVSGRSTTQREQAPREATTASTGIALLPFLRANSAGIGGVFVGLTIATLGFAAIGTWLPVVAIRQFGATPAQVGSALGAATLVSAVIGLLISGFGMRWFAPRFGVRLPVVAMAFSFVSAGVLTIMLLFASSAQGLFLIYGLQLVFVMVGIMAYPTLLQDLAPPHLRGRIFAISGVLGVAFPSLSPPLVGALSDWMGPRPDALLLVTAGFGAFSLMLGGGVLAWAARYHASVARAAQAATAD